MSMGSMFVLRPMKKEEKALLRPKSAKKNLIQRKCNKM